MMATMRAQEVADLLNAYEAAHDDRTNDYNLWQDVIYDLDDYDADATEANDPSGMSDLVVLTDGTWIGWDVLSHQWRVVDALAAREGE